MGPLLLVPAAPAHPLARRGLACGQGDEVHGLFPGLGRAQVHDHQRDAQAGEVGVALDEPRNGEPPGEVDHLGLGTGERPDLRVAADRRDRSAGHGERLRLGPRGIDRDDLPVQQHQVGRFGPALSRVARIGDAARQHAAAGERRGQQDGRRQAGDQGGRR